MASAVFGSGGVYGFLGFGLGPNSGFIIPAWGNNGYIFLPPGTYTSAFSDTASGFGPLLANSWNGPSGAAAFANGLAFEYALSGVAGVYILSGFPISTGSPNLIEAALPYGSTGYFIDSLGGVSAIYSGGIISGLTGSSIPPNLPIHNPGPSISGTSVYVPGGSGGLIKYAFGSPPSATILSPSAFFNSVLCCAINASGIPYAGVNSFAIFSPSATVAAYSSGNPSLLATVAPAYSGGALGVWSGSVSIPGPSFYYINSVSGLGLTSSVAVNWQSTTGMLIVDCGSGILHPYGFAAGSLLSGAGLSGLTGTFPSLASYGGTSAFLPQRSTSGILTFTLVGSTWSSSGSGAISGLTGVAIGPIAISNNILGACYSAGVTFASAGPSGFWSFIGNVPTSSVPTTISVDQNGNFFAAGSGYSYLISPGPSPSLITSAALGYTGIPNGTASKNLQYFISIPGGLISQDLYVASASVNLLPASGQNTWMMNSGPSASPLIPLSGTLIPAGLLYYNGATLLPSLSGIAEVYLGSPYKPEYIAAGGIAYYSGGAWSAVSGTPQGAIPEAICLDVSGNIRFSCIDGTEFSIISGNSAVSAQFIWTQGGGMVGIASGASGIYGAAALAPVVVKFS